MSKNLELAVCLFPDVTALDFQGPVGLLGFLTPNNIEMGSLQSSVVPPFALNITFLSHTLDPVTPDAGPQFLPQGTYADVMKKNIQYDIILVPGGVTAKPGGVPDDVLNFVKHQAPRARYILSVCTGSWILAGTGILDGKRATTNKSVFSKCKAATSDKITWVAKARWVVDGNIWTSSGVTSGMDMANAFLVHLVGEDIARTIRSVIEISARNEDSDEFAEYFGLV